jgi:hypothetical protein
MNCRVVREANTPIEEEFFNRYQIDDWIPFLWNTRKERPLVYDEGAMRDGLYSVNLLLCLDLIISTIYIRIYKTDKQNSNLGSDAEVFQ